MKNINRIQRIVLIACVLILGLACKTDVKEKGIDLVSDDLPLVANDLNNLNVSILLDLSDRISPTKYPNESMEFYKRDAGYIKTISTVFLENLSTKKMRQANEKIELYFEPSPSNSDINNLSKKLKFKITKDNISKEIIDEIEKSYSTYPGEICELAIADNSYVGSDTWRFFKNKVQDYCINEDQRNILIILTDGYIYHEDSRLKEGNRSSYLIPQEIRKNKLNASSWKENFENKDFGFLNIDVDLSNLEILVLGINPDSKNVYEEDVIYEYWSKWFKEMRVKRFAIKQTDLPSNMDKIIREFILN
jgi:hypothetical protein